MLDDDLQDLTSAEDFLDYFAVDSEPRVVQVNRLHILQRFHDYLAAADMPDDEDARWVLHSQLLRRAYGDFVGSDARTEKVFKVFHRQGPAFVALESLA